MNAWTFLAIRILGNGKKEVLFFPWAVLGHVGREAGESPRETEQEKGKISAPLEGAL